MLLHRLILIVDDSDNDARLFTLLLKRARLVNPVKFLNGGAAAISYLKGDGDYADRTKNPLPGILFLDLKMPAVSGYDVLEWLQGRPELKSMLVVALSGWAQMTDVNRAYEMGARSFLSKPCTPEDIANLQAEFPDYWTPPGTASDGKGPSSAQA